LEDDEQALVSRYLHRSESFQGRVASAEQIQIQPEFPQHEKWFELFKSWWAEGFELWKERHVATEDRCVFMCELGPPPYAITGSDGYELSDRWDEALMLKATAEKLWAKA